MKQQLDIVRESYDEAIELGRNGINRYQHLPDYITMVPDYADYLGANEAGTINDSSNEKIVTN